MSKKLKNIILIAITLLIVYPGILSAQGGFDDDVLDNPVPFDGGVTLLLAAGIGYGLKKARDQRQADRK